MLGIVRWSLKRPLAANSSSSAGGGGELPRSLSSSAARLITRAAFSTHSVADTDADTDAGTTDIDDEETMPTVKLYQYAICPFCHRTKAVLGYCRLDYETVEVNPLTKKEIAWSKEYRKVPIATIDDRPYFGSDLIIDGLLDDASVRHRLEARWKKEQQSGESDGGLMDVSEFRHGRSSERWVDYATNDLAPLLYPNICRTWSDSYAAFGYLDREDDNIANNDFTALQRMAIRGIGSFAMYLAASKVKKKRSITDERAALDEALTVLEMDGLLPSSSSNSPGYLSGMSAPNLGDLSVYGTLRSIEGLPTHDEAVYGREGPIQNWYERMKAQVEHKNG